MLVLLRLLIKVSKHIMLLPLLRLQITNDLVECTQAGQSIVHTSSLLLCDNTAPARNLLASPQIGRICLGGRWKYMGICEAGMQIYREIGDWIWDQIQDRIWDRIGDLIQDQTRDWRRQNRRQNRRLKTKRDYPIEKKKIQMWNHS